MGSLINECVIVVSEFAVCVVMDCSFVGEFYGFVRSGLWWVGKPKVSVFMKNMYFTIKNKCIVEIY